MERKPLEADLEAAFGKAVAAQGWEAAKMVSPSHNGRPDRIVLAHYGVTGFAEIKRNKAAAISELQKRELRILTERGFVAMRIDTLSDVALFIHRLRIVVERAKYAGVSHG